MFCDEIMHYLLHAIGGVVISIEKESQASRAIFHLRIRFIAIGYHPTVSLFFLNISLDYKYLNIQLVTVKFGFFPRCHESNNDKFSPFVRNYGRFTFLPISTDG